MGAADDGRSCVCEMIRPMIDINIILIIKSKSLVIMILTLELDEERGGK